MTDPFEQEVRDAARGLGAEAVSAPSYHESWRRGRRRRLIKRAGVAAAGVLALVGTFTVAVGRGPGSQPIQSTDVAAGPAPTAIATETEPSGAAPNVVGPIPTTPPVESDNGNEAEVTPTVEALPTEVADDAGPSSAAGTDAVASPTPTPDQGASSAATQAPTPAPTSTSVPAPTSEAAATPPASRPESETGESDPDPAGQTDQNDPGPNEGNDGNDSGASVASDDPAQVDSDEADPDRNDDTPSPDLSAPDTSDDAPGTNDTGPAEPPQDTPESGDAGATGSAPAPTVGPAPGAADATIVPGDVGFDSAPNRLPCDLDGDALADATCQLYPDYACTGSGDVRAGYTAVDRDGDQVIDTCVAQGLTQCDTNNNGLGDTPCIIELLEPTAPVDADE